MKKVVLLNPPGKKLYIRDYFCSKVSQADYIPPPIDLVFLSGIVATQFDVSLIDAVVSRFSREGTLKLISEINPYAVITLVGAASFEEDVGFLKELKSFFPETKIVCIGDVFLERDESVLKNFPFDAVIFDFTSDDVINFLNGHYEKLKNIIYRLDGEIIVKNSPVRNKTYSIPPPRHDLFLRYNYRYPFVKSKKFITTLVDYGCPYSCKFCVMATLGWKSREVENIVDELKFARDLGVREIFFATQTFGVNKERTMNLCERMLEEDLHFGWVCFSRVDVLDREMLDVMKKAGCHTIILGIESGSQDILDAYRKGYTIGQIKKFLNVCDEMGIETVGTFILGLPDETPGTMGKTLKLLKEIKLGYASFNVAVPRAGTPLRKEAIELNLANDSRFAMDQSGTEIAMDTKVLSRKEVLRYRRKAVFTFYFRWSYLLGRIKKLKSFSDFLWHLRNAFALVKRTYYESKYESK